DGGPRRGRVVQSPRVQYRTAAAFERGGPDARGRGGAYGRRARSRAGRGEGMSGMAVELDPVLAEVLACPAPDHGTLRTGSPSDPSAGGLTCTRCGRVYRVEGGTPVPRLDEAQAPADDGGDRPT